MSEILNANGILDRVWEDYENLTQVSGGTLDIRGGQFAADKLPEFLKAWEGCCENFTWRLWELLHRVDLEHETGVLKPSKGNVPADVERARLFGESGDLLVRRDRQMFYWRFIGNKSAGGHPWPTFDGEYAAQDFEASSGTSNIYKKRTVYHYLWRIGDLRVTTHWLEGKDDLLNLGGKNGKNKNEKDNYLKQIHYLRNGTVEFVKFVDIVKDKGEGE